MGKRAESELDEELAYHLEKLVEENLARGMSPAEARVAARKSFGGIDQTREACRDTRRTRWLEDFARDLGHAARCLRRSPGFTLIVMLTLGLGIGASVAVFGIVDVVLLRPLGVREPERLAFFSEGAQIGQGGPLDPGRIKVISYPLFQRLRSQNQTFQDLAAQQSGETASVVRSADLDDAGGADLAFGRAVTANYFDLLGLAAHRGRFFLPEDETAVGANPVVVLSHRTWQRRFGENSRLLGSLLTINGTRYRVIGVGPPGFTGTRLERVTDFWVPATMQAALWRAGRSNLSYPEAGWLLVIGRLKPGVSLAAAEANVNVILQQFLADNPSLARSEDRPRVRIGLDPGRKPTSDVRPILRDPLLTLMAGAGLLLLIVCLNLSYLMLARARARQREMSVRTALGAGRGRLLRQLLAESLLLSLLGALAALLLARVLTIGLLAIVQTEGTSLVLDLGTDRRVVALAGLLALTCALLLGLVPAWHALRADLHRGLRAAAFTVTGAGPHRPLSRTLLALQVAFSLVLLVGAGLLNGSVRRLRAIDKGFDHGHVLLVELNARMAGFDPTQARRSSQNLLDRLGALPGVRSASMSANAFLSGAWSSRGFRIPRGGAPLETVEAGLNVVTPAYFETLGMTLLRGRAFTTGDRAGVPRVAVVNETFARSQFGGDRVVGQRFGDAKAKPQEIEIVGIVRDAKVVGLRHDVPPMVYLAAAQQDDFLHGLELRAAGDPAALASEVSRLIRTASPSLPILSVRTIANQMDRSIASERILMALSSTFGLMALFLVCVGLYGVIAQRAAQRTGEIGLRMALGASPGGVRWIVLREALVILMAGLAVGLPAAVAAGQLVKSLLFGVDPVDVKTISGAALTLIAVATLAAYLPARRASQVDPMHALRVE